MASLKKLFVVGDLHSCFDEFKEALNKTEYDPENPNHVFISLGDNFDRGGQPQQVLDFLLGCKNGVFIKGNHEFMLENLLKTREWDEYDSANGTLGTVLNLGDESDIGYPSFRECCVTTQKKLAPLFDKMIPFFETQNYIFVHSWIPVGKKPDMFGNPQNIYRPDWRQGNDHEWEAASWGNPFRMAAAGLNKTEKTIVFGHWATALWRQKGIEPDSDFSPVYLKNEQCIGIDGTTNYSGVVNVLCLEDYLLG